MVVSIDPAQLNRLLYRINTGGPALHLGKGGDLWYLADASGVRERLSLGLLFQRLTGRTTGSDGEIVQRGGALTGTAGRRLGRQREQSATEHPS